MAFTKMPPKDPNDCKDYWQDWSDWLQSGEEIVSSEWLLPDGIVRDALMGDGYSQSAAYIFLASGTAGNNYLITNRIRTNQGRSEDDSIIIPCKEL